MKHLSKLIKDRVSIIIAHRISTIKDVDRIIVLENGKIIEDGNFEELMENKKKFYSLVQISNQ